MADELDRARRAFELALMAQPRNPYGVAPENPGLLSGTGIPERLALLNQMFNPVEAIGQSMQAGGRLTAPNAGVMDRVVALGDMLSGVAGVAGPTVAAGRAGVPASAAMMEGLLGWSPTREAAGDIARQFVADESGALRLYHGSPHDFDRFSMSKIGTGEGAQAYGHGLYFAENADIARGYRDNVFGSVPREIFKTDEAHRIVNDQLQTFGATPNALDGAIDDLRKSLKSAEGTQKIWGDQQSRVDALKEAIGFLENKADTRLMIGDRAVSDVYDNISSRADRLPPKAAEAEYNKMAVLEDLMNDGDILAVMQRASDGVYDPATLAWFEKEIAPKFKRQGRMYEVEVNANPEDFLDWDLPLSEQPKKVQEVFRPRIEEFRRLGAQIGNDPDGATLEQIAHPTVQLDDVDWSRGIRQQAADYMREAGIPGIKYLDSGSRGAGEGSRNYVIFDENLINIVRKYGIAGAAAAFGVSQAEVAQAMQQQQPQGLLSGAQ